MTLPGSRLSTAWLALAIVSYTALVLAPGLGGGFFFDDFPNIVENSRLHVTSLSLRQWIDAGLSSPSSELKRPLAMLTFAANHFLSGLDPFPMKLTNLLIHAINTVLVFLLTQSLILAATGGSSSQRTTATRAGVIASLLWAVHPINAGTVFYIVQRMELLSHTFVLLALALYARTRSAQAAGGDVGVAPLAVSLLVLPLIGIAAKESAILVPAYALATELAIFHFSFHDLKTRYRSLALYLSLVAAAGSIAFFWLLPRIATGSAYAGRDFTMGQRLLTEARVLVDYLGSVFFPRASHLHFFHDNIQVSTGLLSPITTAASLAALLLLAAVAVVLRNRRPLTCMGILWFLFAHAITATIIPLELMFEHRNYFASLGACLVVVDLLLVAPRSESLRNVGLLLAATLIAVFTITTRARASEWSNPLALATSEARKNPESPRATYGLARLLIVMSNYDPRSPYFEPAEQAVKEAARTRGASVMALHAELMLAARVGLPQSPDTWRALEEGLKHKPIDAEAIAVLRVMAACANDGMCNFSKEDMAALFSAALTRRRNAEVLNLYGGYVLNSLRDVNDARRLWEEAAAAAPREPQYQVNLARLSLALGERDQAHVHLATARRLMGLRSNGAELAQLEHELAVPAGGTLPSTSAPAQQEAP